MGTFGTSTTATDAAFFDNVSSLEKDIACVAEWDDIIDDSLIVNSLRPVMVKYLMRARLLQLVKRGDT